MSSYAVTGASRGIGLEFIRQLSANADNTVFALVRNVHGATDLRELAKSRSNVHVIEADLLDNNTLKAAASEIGHKTGGSLDYLINNAAHVQPERMFNKLTDYAGHEDLLNKDFIDYLQTSVIGVIQTVNAFLPLLTKGRVKKVITLTSALGDLEFNLKCRFPVHVPYSVSKAAVNMVNVKYASEFREEGFLFLALSPGFVYTRVEKPTEQEMVHLDVLINYFKQGAPEWSGQPVLPQESVESMLKVVSRFTVADTGAFVSHDGNKEWL